jgi:hypothetical protein
LTPKEREKSDFMISQEEKEKRKNIDCANASMALEGYAHITKYEK